VNLVGSALGHDINLRHIPAKLGAVGARLHLEFLERVHGWLVKIRIEVGIGILHAIERVMIELQPLTGKIELEVRARPASAQSGDRVGWAVDCPRRDQRSQLQVVAAVQWQFRDTPVLDHGADGRVLGIEDFPLRRYFDGFGDVAYLQLKVQPRGLIHLQYDVVADFGPESGHRDPD
jgi:hypothetical protein